MIGNRGMNAVSGTEDWLIEVSHVPGIGWRHRWYWAVLPPGTVFTGGHYGHRWGHVPWRWLGRATGNAALRAEKRYTDRRDRLRAATIRRRVADHG